MISYWHFTFLPLWQGKHIKRHQRDLTCYFYSTVMQLLAKAKEYFWLNCLPIKFLGVPLIYSKLSLNDCTPLIDKITSKCNSWANVSLLCRKSSTHKVSLSKPFGLLTLFFLRVSYLLSRVSFVSSCGRPRAWKVWGKVAWNDIALPVAEEGCCWRRVGS